MQALAGQVGRYGAMVGHKLLCVVKFMLVLVWASAFWVGVASGPVDVGDQGLVLGLCDVDGLHGLGGLGGLDG